MKPQPAPRLKLLILSSYPTELAFAKTVKLSKSLLSKIVRGHREPTATQRASIAKALNMSEVEVWR